MFCFLKKSENSKKESERRAKCHNVIFESFCWKDNHLCLRRVVLRVRGRCTTKDMARLSCKKGLQVAMIDILSLTFDIFVRHGHPALIFYLQG